MRQKFRLLLSRLSIPWVAAACVLLSVVVFRNQGSQTAGCTAPYLSGAANWHPFEEWKVDPGCVREMGQLPRAERTAHVFQPARDPATLVEFKSMDPGWMWSLWFSKAIFPFLGDLAGAVALSLILHLLLGSTVFFLIRDPAQRGLFVLLYLANPLVVHVVTFPYYYAWQAHASCAVLLLFLIPRERLLKVAPVIWSFLALCVAVRPSVSLLVLGAAGWFVWHHRARWIAWAQVGLLLAAIFSLPKVNKPFWHTAYVGLGAYPNSHGLYLSDDMGREFSRQKLGVAWSADVGGEFHDPEFRARYDAALREECMRIVREDPWLPLRNALLNTAVLFAWVYAPGAPFALHLACAVLGVAIGILLVRRRQWGALVGTVLSSGAVAMFYPPIAAYVVGSYVFLALGLIRSLLPDHEQA